MSASVKDVWPLGLDVVRLYLLSNDVKLLLPSSDEDASINKEKRNELQPFTQRCILAKRTKWNACYFNIIIYTRASLIKFQRLRNLLLWIFEVQNCYQTSIYLKIQRQKLAR